MSTAANRRQVGGTHYKTTYEHWDLVVDLGLGYLDGVATKYVTRSRKKNGLEDLMKAAHYVDKMIETYPRCRPPRWYWSPSYLDEVEQRVAAFVTKNELNEDEAFIVYNLTTWSGQDDLIKVRERLLALMTPKPVPLTEENHHSPRVGEPDEA